VRKAVPISALKTLGNSIEDCEKKLSSVNPAFSKCFSYGILHGKEIQPESEVKGRREYFHNDLILSVLYIYSLFFIKDLISVFTQRKLQESS
jgi:hypothetical protein